MLLRTISVFLVVSTLAACSKGVEKTDKAAGATSDRPLLISPEDLYTVRNSALASGPSINGSVQPERRADLRAEVPAVVLQVLKQNGDIVRRGDLLVRLDDTAIRDSLASAEASARAADQSRHRSQRAACDDDAPHVASDECPRLRAAADDDPARADAVVRVYRRQAHGRRGP